MHSLYLFDVSLVPHFLIEIRVYDKSDRVRNLKFTTYPKFATCENTNKINELRCTEALNCHNFFILLT